MLRKIATLTLAVLAVSACAAEQPVVYARGKSPAAGHRAIRHCDAQARAAQANGTLPRLLRETAQRVPQNAVLGAGAGAVAGRGLKGAAAGAAAGVVVAFAEASVDGLENDSLHVQYMQLCLSELGYQVVGWR